LLSKARAEFAAIQGIVSGAGTETKMREVSKGDIIAFVISGASCNSTGTHLHFIVKSGNTVINPFSQLKNIDFVNYAYGDPFNPSGSWDWPLSPPIRFNQGYGVTNYVLSGGWYDFHNGIDIASSSNAVLAVESGTLYRGSYSGNGGCTLPYVKLEHKDSDYSTLYLHVFAQ
jgi:murein DD-endopeptidase MepM/ murein hydrolase activator NlpD